MKLKVENDNLTIIEDSLVRAKAINVYDIEIDFSKDWDEFTTKEIIFSNR